MKKITFSIDTHKISKSDFEKLLNMIEKEFKTEEDPEQISIKNFDYNKFIKKFPYGINMIKKGREVLGDVFMFSTTITLMNNFLEKKINERQLYNKSINKKNQDKFTAIYLCSAYIKKEYRRKGLISKAFVKSIKKISNNSNEKFSFFTWPFSKEGEKLAKNVALKLNMSIKIRK